MQLLTIYQGVHVTYFTGLCCRHLRVLGSLVGYELGYETLL